MTGRISEKSTSKQSIQHHSGNRYSNAQISNNPGPSHSNAPVPASTVQTNKSRHISKPRVPSYKLTQSIRNVGPIRRAVENQKDSLSGHHSASVRDCKNSIGKKIVNARPRKEPCVSPFELAPSIRNTEDHQTLDRSRNSLPSANRKD